jgi:L-threonylcarbamoyladenylate synthase
VILEDSESAHRKAAELISQGGLIAFRTDTFYGLGVDPSNRASVQRIKELKGREEGKPILIVISDRKQLRRFVSELSSAFETLANKFWPGPLTLIGKARAEIPEEITAGTGTVGVRLPREHRVRALIEACGGALTATSANIAKAPASTTALEVEEHFGEAIDLIIDDGPAKTDQPSTVVDVTNTPRLIREGVLSWAQIESALRETLSR